MHLSENIDKKTFWRCILFFFICGFLIYGKGIRNEYSMDDEFVTLNNAQVHKGIKAIPQIFKTTYVIDNQKTSYEYRPIVKATYAIEYQIFGENPHVSHFLNILLYLFSVSFLFFLLLRLLPAYHYFFSFLIAMIFLVHPLHSEVVMSIKNRDVLLSFLGCLSALYFYLKFVGSGKWIHLFMGAFFILFALMSKKDSMTFYAIIPLTIYFFTKKTPIKKYLYVVGSYLLPLIIFRLASRNVASNVSRKVLEWENPLFFGTKMLDRIPTGLYDIYFYIKMFLIPHPLLSYYGYNQVPIAKWDHPAVIIVLLSLLVLGYYVLRQFKYKSIELYGILYFLITISMFTNIVKPVVGIVGERFAYIPSLGLCILGGWLLFKAFKIPIDKLNLKLSSFNNLFFIAFAVIIVGFGARTFARNPAWKDHYTLYETDVKNAPESAHLHTLFAAANVQKVVREPKMDINLKRKHISNAVKHYKESLRIIPDYISSLNNLGMVYYSYYSKPEESIPYLKKAILLDTNYVEAYFNLASCEASLKRYDIAEKYYLRSMAIDPEFINNYYSLSSVYAAQKKYSKILAINQVGIARGLKSDIFHINIGNVYFMKGDTLKALPHLEKGIEINPNNRYLNSFLADFYKRNGDLTKANHYYDLMGRSSK